MLYDSLLMMHLPYTNLLLKYKHTENLLVISVKKEDIQYIIDTYCTLYFFNVDNVTRW